MFQLWFGAMSRASSSGSISASSAKAWSLSPTISSTSSSPYCPRSRLRRILSRIPAIPSATSTRLPFVSSSSLAFAASGNANGNGLRSVSLVERPLLRLLLGHRHGGERSGVDHVGRTPELVRLPDVQMVDQQAELPVVVVEGRRELLGHEGVVHGEAQVHPLVRAEVRGLDLDLLQEDVRVLDRSREPD